MKDDSTTTARYYGVQALRGFAAIMVVLFHVVKMMHDKLGGPPVTFAVGSSGVDIFFAISGFVMVITTARRWGEPGLWRIFLIRRLWRIVPLYWLMTGTMVVLLLLAPNLAEHSALRPPWHAIASFLFIPAWNAQHEAYPLIVVGWTLSFEMLFYLLFTVALALRLQPVWWVSAILFAFVPLSFLRTDAWGAPATLFSPLLLEFAFGMWIGMATLNHRLPASIAIWLASAMIAWIFLSELLPDDICFQYRVIIWGVPGALLVASVVALEGRLRPYVRGLPSLLGDASYAIYLSHGFAVTFISIIFARLRLAYPFTMAGGFIGSILLSLAVGIAVYRLVEQSLLPILKGFTLRPVSFSFDKAAS